MIVDIKRLNKYMSSPQWTPEQADAAGDVLAGVESTLEAALMTYITPRTRTEEAVILSTGLVATRHPVCSILSIDGVAVTTDPQARPGEHAVPAGWQFYEHRLRKLNAITPTPLGYNLPSERTSWGLAGRIEGVGAVNLVYAAGWGEEWALRKAILDKARAIMTNVHDDTVVIRTTDGAKPPPMPSEDWSDAELAKLGIYRNLSATR